MLTTWMPLAKHAWPLSCHESDWLVSREFLVCGPHTFLSPFLSSLLSCDVAIRGSTCTIFPSERTTQVHFFASLRWDTGGKVWAEVMPRPSSNQQLRRQAVQTCWLCPSMGMHTEMDVSSSVSSATQKQGCSHNIPILYPTCGDQAGCGSASLGPS